MNLAEEIKWFEAVLAQRLTAYFEGQPMTELTTPPKLKNNDCPYARFVRENSLDTSDRMLLMLALAPSIKPQALDVFFTRNKGLERGFTEFGGVMGKHHGGFLPTLETAIFLYGGDDVGARLCGWQKFTAASPLFAKQVLEVGPAPPEDPLTSATLRVNPEFVATLTGMDLSLVNADRSGPARRLNSSVTLHDLIVPIEVHEELATITAWVQGGHQSESELGMTKYFMPGYRCLFWGPPGTGKTHAVQALGNELGLHVYRVDLSSVVSKWIGETEKNLARVFTMAAKKNWLLFFDEADALFGKRTVTSSAHDRHANQEIAYLLERMENHAGLIVMASNLRTNMDDAFRRRIQSYVHFPMPTSGFRAQLWRMITSPLQLHEVDLDEIAREFELSGGSIANVVRHVLLRMQRESRDQICTDDIRAAVERELRKEGRTA